MRKLLAALAAGLHPGHGLPLRVDHPDGLLDPTGYFDRLAVAAPGAWIIAEKILEPGEDLRADWPIAGTTGYDFLNELNGVFVDPAGEGPRLYFQRVPESKTAKNRVHLDVRVAGREVRGEERKRLVSEHVERLVQAGASLAWRTDDVRGSSVTLYDPEGNEFCVT